MRDALANVATMVRLSWAADRRRSLGALLAVMFLPLSGSMRAVGVAVVADGVVTGRNARVVAGITAIAALTGAQHVLEWASLALRMRLRENTILYLDQRQMELVGGLPGLEHHERPDYADRLALLKFHRGSLVNPFMPIPWTVAALVQLAATMVILGRLHAALWLLPLAAVPSLIGSIVVERRWKEMWRLNAEDHRLLTHLFELGTTARAAKEVRLFGLGAELQRRHVEAFDAGRGPPAAGQRPGHGGQGRRMGRSSPSATWAPSCSSCAAAVAGELSVGDAVLVIGLGGQVNGQVGELVYLHVVVEPDQRGRGPLPLARRPVGGGARPPEAAVERRPVPDRLVSGITLHGVGFTYPTTEAPVLRGVDLHLPAGAIVAVVGENGAGKTTLVKLLLRFYDPTAGRITVDGIDLRQLGTVEWRSRHVGQLPGLRQAGVVGPPRGGGRPPRPRSTTTRPSWARWNGAAAQNCPTGSPAGLDTQLGARLRRRGRPVRRPVAEGGAEPGHDARGPAAARARRAHRQPRRLHRARPVRAVLRPGPPGRIRHRRHHRAGQPPLLHRPHGRPHPGRRRRRGLARSAPTGSCVDLDGHYAELYRLQARSYA